MNMRVNRSRHCGFTTRSSHLRRLKNGEDAAWREFYRKYRAMILAIGKKKHLPEKESEDLMQEVAAVCHRRMQSFVYEPERCRFRSFLFKIVVNLSFNLLRKSKQNVPDKFLPESITGPGIDEEIVQEYENFLLDRSFLILKESVDSETYLVFELLVIENRPVPEVAAISGKTPNTIYSIKHRCLKKLQKIITLLESRLETPPDTGSPSVPNTTSR